MDSLLTAPRKNSDRQSPGASVPVHCLPPAPCAPHRARLRLALWGGGGLPVTYRRALVTECCFKPRVKSCDRLLEGTGPQGQVPPAHAVRRHTTAPSWLGLAESECHREERQGSGSGSRRFLPPWSGLSESAEWHGLAGGRRLFFRQFGSLFSSPTSDGTAHPRVLVASVLTRSKCHSTCKEPCNSSCR